MFLCLFIVFSCIIKKHYLDLYFATEETLDPFRLLRAIGVVLIYNAYENRSIWIFMRGFYNFHAFYFTGATRGG